MDLEDRMIEGAKAYFAFRFLLACLGMFIGVIAGVCFVCHWVFREVMLEVRYHQKYGADWQAEFERYHGTLSHAHAQIAVCVGSMIAVVLVLGWFCHKTYRLHRHHRSCNYVA